MKPWLFLVVVALVCAATVQASPARLTEAGMEAKYGSTKHAKNCEEMKCAVYSKSTHNFRGTPKMMARRRTTLCKAGGKIFALRNPTKKQMMVKPCLDKEGGWKFCQCGGKRKGQPTRKLGQWSPSHKKQGQWNPNQKNPGQKKQGKWNPGQARPGQRKLEEANPTVKRSPTFSPTTTPTPTPSTPSTPPTPDDGEPDEEELEEADDGEDEATEGDEEDEFEGDVEE
ncbi:hypothetical protein AJ79_03140 [Helicocarpus griseus UAMH5409]|uniref:Uncharacterized protein n=1 Tax=Helicocarpus griseus UAMH5409 TaxID=1447875 RepID=A0A2B7Y0I5_9EURO|nr:hypothetical protein AJ79_03140 [Helicocarpus griseus UAMH5409]